MLHFEKSKLVRINYQALFKSDFLKGTRKQKEIHEPYMIPNKLAQ